MEWMVSISFRPQDQAAITALIPQEQAHIKTLREQGIVQALYIGTTSRVWVVMRGDSEAQVHQYLEALPLYPYMEVEITPLANR